MGDDVVLECIILICAPHNIRNTFQYSVLCHLLQDSMGLFFNIAINVGIFSYK